MVDRGFVRTALLVTSIVFPLSAGAQILSMVPEQTTYAVGEEVVVHLVADSAPGSDYGVFARMYYDGALLGGAMVERVPLTCLGGTGALTMGSAGCGADQCDVLWGLIGPGVSPLSPIQASIDAPPGNLWSTIRFTATAPGEAELEIHPYEAPFSAAYTTASLYFFGQSAVAPVTITIVGPTQVPVLGPAAVGALMLLAAGTGVWALARRSKTATPG